MLFYSDGLVEAHSPEREMFGFPRLAALMSDWTDSVPLIERMLGQLAAFTGAGWEQEDDVTLVSLRREQDGPIRSMPRSTPAEEGWEQLDIFEVASAVGNERGAMKRVGEALEGLALPAKQVDQLKTAVAEATMNAMEHGNRYQADLPVRIEVRASSGAVAVRISDEGGTRPIPETTEPNLEAKLS